MLPQMDTLITQLTSLLYLVSVAPCDVWFFLCFELYRWCRENSPFAVAAQDFYSTPRGLRPNDVTTSLAWQILTCLLFHWNCPLRTCLLFHWNCPSRTCFLFHWNCPSRTCFLFHWNCPSRTCLLFHWNCPSRTCLLFHWNCSSVFFTHHPSLSLSDLSQKWSLWLTKKQSACNKLWKRGKMIERM